MRKTTLLFIFIAVVAIAFTSCKKEEGTDIPAELVDGPTFSAAIPDSATAVVFEYSSKVSSGTLLSTADSPVPIYGNLEGTVWKISTKSKKINANPNCTRMFYPRWNEDIQEHLPRIQTITFGEGFNTGNVTIMLGMFDGCNYLTSLDLSHFNTENVTNMISMFCGCYSLSSLDLSHFNTSNVTNMSWMFGYCSNLTSLNLSNFNTTNVTNMSGMFYSCNELESLDLSNFNTTNVTDMSLMFHTCYRLRSLNLSDFNTTNVTDMSCMFLFCISLTNLDITNFNTTNVTNMMSMFDNCSGLTNLDLSNFNTENVTSMMSMFMECQNLMNLDLSNFKMDNVDYKERMCSNLSTTSGHCTITCPVAVQSELENGTDLPTSGVTFTWVRPTSK